MMNLLSLLLIFFTAYTLHQPENNEIEKQVIIYNTYGYEDGDEWVIPMRVYVMETRRSVESVVTGLFSRRRNLNGQQREVFRSRIADFVADSESREQVVFAFDGDPRGEEFQIEDENGEILQTDLNGIAEGFIRLSSARAEELLEKQGSKNGWLTVRTTSNGHYGQGYIRLIEPEGLSVISDVDDTVKITGLPAGRDFVIRKTFFENFSSAPGMAARYKKWDNAAFHYVSGAPWQLYRPLSSFLFNEEGFPKGTFHMKFVPKNLVSITTWRSLSALATNENVTYEQKIEQISGILNDFPKREFILVGDSGERDPEVYREIAARYPNQVKEIYIRDVINNRELDPARLKGMNIIPAPAFVRAVREIDR